jgi:predicted  nucleic acid-binding Zn-ribbon protein
MAQIKSNYFAILHENEDLRKAYTKLQADYDKLKNEYDGCKRDLEKASQEVSTTES